MRLRTLHQVTGPRGARERDLVEQVLATTLADAFAATATSVWRTARGGRAAGAGHPPATGSLAAAGRRTVGSLVEAAVLTGDVVVVESLDHAAREHPHLLDGMVRRRLQTLVVVPLLADGVACGAYCVAYARSRPPDADQLELHRTLGRHAGQALQRAQRQDELGQLALHDPLTGLPNRTLLFDRLQQALARAVRNGSTVMLVAVQLDDFAVFADGLGLGAAEQVLVQVAHRLSAEIRPSDTVARLANDEFVVLCDGADQEASQTLVRRLHEAMGRSVAVGEAELAIQSSVAAVVHLPTAASDTSAVDLLRDVDAELHRVRRRSAGAGAESAAPLRVEAAERARVEALLRDALADDGLVLHYQPLYDLASGAATGVEALCRLRDDEGELVMPGEFIPIAEQRGLVVHLGWQVLRSACAQLARWHRAGLDVDMSVNVAAEQAAQPQFAELVAQTLAAHDCPPERLMLELTESTVLTASSDMLAGLTRVRDLGVGIAIDDFGTRYASLHYVQHFPLTELKIDRSFVQGLPGRRVERAIVAAVAGMAGALDLVCVAEGIETRQQHDALVELGLGIRGQGYLLGRPAPAEQCEAMLRRPALG
jgi:diguanylate cyclase (GGDEF)-like protein